VIFKLPILDYYPLCFHLGDDLAAFIRLLKQGKYYAQKIERLVRANSQQESLEELENRICQQVIFPSKCRSRTTVHTPPKQQIRGRAERATAYFSSFFFRTNVTFGFHFSGSLSLNESMS